MSPRYPSVDLRIVREALQYTETHTANATAVKFGVPHHTIQRWRRYRDERTPAWPTGEDIADWDAKQPERAKGRQWKRRYVARLHLNGGQPMKQPAHGTIRRLKALCAIGWTHRELGARLGVSNSRVSHIIRLTRTGVLIETAQAVAALYDELAMIVPTGRNAAVARAAAASKGWAPPLAWDDEAIDDLNARPIGMLDHHRATDALDESAIERRIFGDRTVHTRGPENVEVVRRMLANGLSQSQIRRITGLKVERYVVRASTERAA